MKTRELSVRLHGLPIGVLAQTPSGSLQFEYLPEAKQAISLSMPLGKKKFGNAVCEAYFGGLLPESENAKRLIAAKYGVSANNTFSLLAAIGYDCAGAISLQLPSEKVIADDWHRLIASPMSQNELAEHVRNLPNKPLLTGVDGIRLSLAGVQDKAAVVVKDGKVCLPVGGCPTTHILKPEIANFSGSVQNEFLCMKMAMRLGIVAASVEIRQAKGIKYLLVERFDRHIRDGKLRRIHQEDFCQALAVRTSNKYQNEGGPGFKSCFDLLLQASRPALERNRLAKVMIFNLLIGNADAHGKNFALLHNDFESISLAPFYDLLSTHCYPQLTREMAMKIGDKYLPDRLEKTDWQKLCNAINYSFPILQHTIKEMSEQLPEVAKQERDSLKDTDHDHSIADQLLEVIDKNCRQMIKPFGH